MIRKKTAKSLYGSWKLVSHVVEELKTGARHRPFGARPNGYLVLERGGRMMALLTAKSRKGGQTDAKAAALYRSMLSYTGRFRLKDGKFITKVDASWNEDWNGTSQARKYRLAGDKLELINDWAPRATLPGAPVVRAVLTWKRTR